MSKSAHPEDTAPGVCRNGLPRRATYKPPEMRRVKGPRRGGKLARGRGGAGESRWEGPAKITCLTAGCQFYAIIWGKENSAYRRQENEIQIHIGMGILTINCRFFFFLDNYVPFGAFKK